MPALELDVATTALVLIDLQRGIVARPAAPHPAIDVVTRAANLARLCRQRGILVVLVRVGFDKSLRDRLNPPADTPNALGQPSPDFSDLLPALEVSSDDVLILKRQWGAFYGTDLDLQLRRRGIKTLLLGGIATNFGVESTARDAYERAYQLVFLEDCMTSVSAELHRFTVEGIFPRIGLVRSTADVVAALR